MDIIWSPTAKKRIDEIVGHISADNLNAAWNLVENIESQVQQLKNSPKLGRVASALNDENIRELVVHKNYIVVYELTKNGIIILTIRHSKQDVNKQSPSW